MRISGERLGEIVGAEEHARSETLIPNLLIEVSSVPEFEDAMSAEQISAEGRSTSHDVFPNPVIKGSFTIGQLLKLVELDCVISIEEDFIKRLINTVESNLANEALDVEFLSNILNMSRRQLLRKIQAITGQAPSVFIRSYRLQTAKKLIEQKTGTVSEIAFGVGFNNLSYFSKIFKAEFGKAPSELS